MKYSLGLDIGISSVGWAVVDLDPTNRRIVDMGVRCFDAAEVAKTKEPLAKERREARSARRRSRRLRGRKESIKQLFIDFGLVSLENNDTVYRADTDKYSPWELRCESLDRLLNSEELARALYHIAKRRGFKSNRKTDKDGENGKVLEAVSKNKLYMEEKKYRTAGEMLSKDAQYSEKKRNSNDNYINSIDRDTLLEEIKLIFECQRVLGSDIATEKLEKEYTDRFLFQKHYAAGGHLDKIGYCTFEKSEKRAAKSSYSVSYFRMLQEINNIRIFKERDEVSLNDEERTAIIEKALSLKKFNYQQLRTLLEKSFKYPPNSIFKNVTYVKDIDGYIVDTEKPEKTKFISDFTEYKNIEKIFNEHGLWNEIKDNTELIDDIAFYTTAYKTDDEIKDAIKEKYASLKEEILNAVTEVPTSSKFVHLSAKALRNIIPYLEMGMRYDEACTEAGYNHSQPNNEKQRTKKLPVLNNRDEQDENDKNRSMPPLYVSPVAFRSITQARKVLNAVIEKHGSPVYVNIELARDMSKTVEERNQISKENEKNQQAKEQARELFINTMAEKNINVKEEDVKPVDVLKLRLYKQQNGKCVYSGKDIELGYLENYQIDHILPYSRSFNDSFTNKVLVTATENQNKRNMTPFEYFGNDTEKWNEFEARVNTINDFKKRKNLLTTNFNEREAEMTEANLNDTRTICTKFAQLLDEYLDFETYTRTSKSGEQSEVKKHVRTVNGMLTSMMRGVWGLKKIRSENDATELEDMESYIGDLHHAMDAAVIACINDSDIKRMTRFYKAKEDYDKFIEKDHYIDEETGEEIQTIRAGGKRNEFLPPWPTFRNELIKKLHIEEGEEGHITISRMPQRGTTGAIHKETIRSTRIYDETGLVISRKSLDSLKLEDFNVLDRLDDYTEQEKGLVDPKNNLKLYSALRERLREYDGDAKKAFKDPFYKPRIDGTDGPRVKTIKTAEPSSGIRLNRGFVENGSMIRIDVFKKDKKYYIVPVYTIHTYTKELPTRAIKINKPENEWTIIDDSYEFINTFYPYDLVKVIDKKGDIIWGYYRGTDRSTAWINVSTPNSKEKGIRCSVQTAQLIEKYEIDVLGKYHKVRKEKRSGLEKRSNKK